MKAVKFIRTENRMVAARSWGRGVVSEFQLSKMDEKVLELCFMAM